MVDAIPGMSLVITKLLYEKGLEIPMHNQSNRESLSRARSRASMRSSGRASECSLTINSREDDGIISRCTILKHIFIPFILLHISTLFYFATVSERSFVTTSSSVSRTSTKSTKRSEKSMTATSSTLNFQIEGQSIRSDKPTK